MADFSLTEHSTSFDALSRLFAGIDRLRVPVTAIQGAISAYYVTINVEGKITNQAIDIGILGEAVYQQGSALINGGGHMIGAIGRVANNNTVNALPLAIGVEGKIDNIAGATITSAIPGDFNLGSNAGTITNLFFSFGDIGSNAGTIGTAAGVVVQVESNTGTITNLAGVFVPTLNSPGTITNLYGLFYGSNPAAGITNRFCIQCLDANAIINTIGPIVTTNLTTTDTFKLASGTKTATAVAGAATLNKASGKITTEAGTNTAIGLSYTLTLTNSTIAAADTVFASVDNGTNTTADATVTRVTPAAGSVVILVKNTNSTTAFNGSLVISFAVMKA